MGKQVSEKTEPSYTSSGNTWEDPGRSTVCFLVLSFVLVIGMHDVCTLCGFVTQLRGHNLSLCHKWALRQECEWAWRQHGKSYLEASCSRKAGFRRAWPPCWVKTSICLGWGPRGSLLGLEVTKPALYWGWREASPHAHNQKMSSASEWVVCLGEEEVQPPCYCSHFQLHLD